MPSNTLTVTDNRTGKSYELAITNGAIRALDLRQIRTGTDDFGLLSYDPPSPIQLPPSAGSPRSTATRAFSGTGAIRSRSLPSAPPTWKLPTSCSTANYPR
jgi:hypothetical protein